LALFSIYLYKHALNKIKATRTYNKIKIVLVDI